MKTLEKQLIIAEDEPPTAAIIEDVARALGWSVLGRAATEADAFGLLKYGKPSLAVLNLDLGPATSLAVASSCKERGIAVLFINGYPARDIPEQCGDAPVLAKPFSRDELARSFMRALCPVTLQAQSNYSRRTNVKKFQRLELDCPSCGTRNALISDENVALEQIRCSKCGTELGQVAALQRVFDDTNSSAPDS